MKVFVVVLCAIFGANGAPFASIDDNQVDGDLESIDLSQYGSSIYRIPSNETGYRVANYNPDDGMNPEELGDYLEGDMVMPHDFGRNGLIAASSHWPNGIVPFEINGDYSAGEMNLLEKAIDEYHKRTCVRFRPRSNERDYIVFTSDATGCWSSVGRIGGRQAVNLQSPGCLLKVGTVIHEMMHALGFFHEQNRSDRDDFVRVNWNNVRNGMQVNFDKASSYTTTAYGVSYDYGSVMHYSPTAFSRNGQPTITAKRSADLRSMGQRESLSHSDEAKINRMYKCEKKSHETQANGRRFVNEIAAFFDNYASPAFWRGVFNSWSQPPRVPQQPQHLPQQLPQHLPPPQHFPPAQLPQHLPPHLPAHLPPHLQPQSYFNDYDYYFPPPYGF